MYTNAHNNSPQCINNIKILFYYYETIHINLSINQNYVKNVRNIK